MVVSGVVVVSGVQDVVAPVVSGKAMDAASLLVSAVVVNIDE